MTWNELPAGPLGAAASLPGIDANLVWADASGWRDFLRAGQRAKKLIPVIAEIEPGSAPAFAESVSKAGGSIPPVYRSNRTTHCTAMLTAAHCADLLQAAGGGGPVRRFELQAPLIPQRPRVPPEAPGPAPPREESEKARGRLLVGVIDHGCPFAHQHLRRGSRGIRILNLWLQDETLPERTRRPVATPPEFGYGVAQLRRFTDKLMQRQPQDDGSRRGLLCRNRHGRAAAAFSWCRGPRLFVGPRPLIAHQQGPVRADLGDLEQASGAVGRRLRSAAA